MFVSHDRCNARTSTQALAPEFQLNEAVLIAEADWERDMRTQQPGAHGKDVHHDINKRRMFYDDFFESM